MMYTPNLIRSSVVPHTIANETAQKTNWKNHFDSIVALERSITGKVGWKFATPFTIVTYGPIWVKKAPPSCPMKLPAGPLKANIKPTAHHAIAAIEKFVRIFATTVPAFFAREKPISRNANPACMNMTSEPATITQVVFTPTLRSSFPAIDFLRSVASARADAGTSSTAPSATSATRPNCTPRRERARGKVERLIRPPRVGCTPGSLLEGQGLVFSLVSKDWPTPFAMLSSVAIRTYCPMGERSRGRFGHADKARRSRPP